MHLVTRLHSKVSERIPESSGETGTEADSKGAISVGIMCHGSCSIGDFIFYVDVTFVVENTNQDRGVVLCIGIPDGLGALEGQKPG